MLWLAVALGGALGAVARHAAALMVANRVGAAAVFPAGTFAVNVVGCFLAGVLLSVFGRIAVSEPTRAFLMVGVLGGFTTFSAFGTELFLLLKAGEPQSAIAYVLTSVLLGVVVLWCGFSVTTWLVGPGR